MNRKRLRLLSFAIGYAFILTTGGWMVGYEHYLLATMTWLGAFLIIPALDSRLQHLEEKDKENAT